MWFTVEPIFSALSACQVLHPDPDDFDSDEHYEEGNTKNIYKNSPKKCYGKSLFLNLLMIKDQGVNTASLFNST